MTDDSGILKHFCGQARLFPLPNVVLFPHVIQPLHIFEPRYREMTSDALSGDRLIAPVLLQPGWESDYDGAPAVHSVMCVGRIVAEQRLPDGRYNLLLRGVSRARIVEELPQDVQFRIARVELMSDGDSPNEDEVSRLRTQIGKEGRSWFPTPGPAQEQFDKLLQSNLTLTVLCDLLSFAVPLAVEVKQQLLEELDVERRARLLLDHLRGGQNAKPTEAANRGFPPSFSDN